MKQHDPEARQSCFGIHTEPCSRYHQIMFFLGMSHTCFACRLSNEQHEKRHIGVRRVASSPLGNSALKLIVGQIAVLVSESKGCEDSERLAMTPIRQGKGLRRSTNDAV